MDNEAFVISNK